MTSNDPASPLSAPPLSQGALLIKPRINPLAGIITALLSTAIFLTTAHASWTGGLRSLGDWLGLALGSVFGLLLWRVSVVLLAPRGGLRANTQALVLGGAHARDIVEIPATSLREVRVFARRPESHGPAPGNSPEYPAIFSVEVGLAPSGWLLVGESTVEDEARTFATDLRRALGVSVFGEPAAGPAGETDEMLGLGAPAQWSVGSGWALADVVGLLGLGSIALGALLFAHVESGPLAGFVFAPPLALLGLALLGLWAVRAAGHEWVTVGQGVLTHRVTIGRFTLREATLGADSDARVRMRPRGAHGWLLEAVNVSRVLPMAPGVSKRARCLDPQKLLVLAQQLDGELLAARAGQPVGFSTDVDKPVEN